MSFWQQTSRAQDLLSSAHQALAEAITLCLQHKLPSAILADASLTMVDCHGQGDPELAGQHLALFQVQWGKNSYILLVFCGQNVFPFCYKEESYRCIGSNISY